MADTMERNAMSEHTLPVSSMNWKVSLLSRVSTPGSDGASASSSDERVMTPKSMSINVATRPKIHQVELVKVLFPPVEATQNDDMVKTNGSAIMGAGKDAKKRIHIKLVGAVAVGTNIEAVNLITPPSDSAALVPSTPTYPVLSSATSTRLSALKWSENLVSNDHAIVPTSLESIFSSDFRSDPLASPSFALDEVNHYPYELSSALLRDGCHEHGVVDELFIVDEDFDLQYEVEDCCDDSW